MRSVRDGLAESTRWGTTRLRHLQPILRRHTGALVVGSLVLALVIMVGVGTGYHPRTAQALDGGAWLGSANGTVVHANGTSARIDWVLDATPGSFQIIQQGTGGLIDEAQGDARTIDGSSMKLSRPTALGSGQPQLAAGGGRAYVVYHSSGTVQPVDPTSLTPMGQSLTLGGQVGSTAVDAQGVLYAVLDPSGTVDTIDGGAVEAQVSGGSSSTQLVAVGGSVVGVDAQDGTVTGLAADGRAEATDLGLPSGTHLAVPTSAGSSLWVTDTSSGDVLEVEPGRGVAEQIPVGANGSQLSAPQATGDVVYVADAATGAVLTVDPRTRATAHDVVFDPGTDVQLFAKDGLVWGNDFGGPKAMVADATGTIKVIDKYTSHLSRPTKVPRQAHKKVHKPAHRAARKAKKTKKKPKKAKRTKRTKVHKRATATTSTTAGASTTTSTTLPFCATTTTTTPPSTTSSTVPTSSSTTSTTAPCTPPPTTCPPQTTSTTSTTVADTSSSTSTTEAGTTTTTNPCQPTTTTSSTTSTTSTTSPP